MTQRPKTIKEVNSSLKADDREEKFDVHSIIKSVQMQDDISIKQLQNQIKQFRLIFKQALRDMGKLKKQIQLRPTCHSLMENTILITTSIQSDPNIMKLMHTREDKYNLGTHEENEEQSDPNKQLKRVSLKLGSKIAQVNDCLPLLLGLIKDFQKHITTQICQIKSFTEEKTHSIQDQLNHLKIQQISQRLSLTQKLQSQYEVTQQKIRHIQTKQIWQLKELNNKLLQKISKQTLDNCLYQIMDENKKVLRNFQEETNSFVSPEKIKELQQSIKENRQKLNKDLVQCHINIDSISTRINKQLVNIDFYKKQRTSLEKRISSLNLNFQEVHEKVFSLKQKEVDHLNRLVNLQNENNHKTKNLQEMKSILRNLSITEEFQQMLSKIDPQKILVFQTKIQQLQQDNKHVFKLFGQVNEQMDKINNKFQISGVMVPNKSRDKQFQLNDLKNIIDQYFVQNRFANKITKIQAQLNDGKASVQAIRILDKKISRLQKQSQYSQVIQQFQRLEQNVKRQIKILEEKIQVTLSQNGVNKAYFEGLFTNMGEKKIGNDIQNQQFREVVVIKESSDRMVRQKTENRLSQRSSSLRKIIPWQNTNKEKEINSSFYKNTVSSARKNLLKSSNILLGS